LKTALVVEVVPSQLKKGSIVDKDIKDKITLCKQEMKRLKKQLACPRKTRRVLEDDVED
jgi:hypothetical protein